MDPTRPYKENRAWLVQFYQKNNPKKLRLVDQTLETYRGREHVLSAVRPIVLFKIACCKDIIFSHLNLFS